MSFFRKLLGGGDAPPKRRGVRPPSPTPPSPDLPPDVPTAITPRPAPADTPPGPRRRYLEYVGGGSSKFYAVILDQDSDETWGVQFNFGRIGFPRAWAGRIEDASWAKAIASYTSLVDEKLGKGYESRPWPADLKLPDGSDAGPGETSEGDAEATTLYRSRQKGTLPPERGGTVAGISLPDGRLYSPDEADGPRGQDPVIWASTSPVRNVAETWSSLAAAFADTGIWPVVIDSTYGFDGFGDYLIDIRRGRHTEVAAILRKAWNERSEYDDGEPDESIAPFGKQFPGLADATPGGRPSSIDRLVAELDGHLGLVAVNRPADVLDAIGWMGAANYDGDPLDMSTVLRSWETRFDAYLVGLGTDTLVLAVGRPARDLSAATAIAAEHLAFCPDNIDQGAGSIRDYAPMLVNSALWMFWWD